MSVVGILIWILVGLVAGLIAKVIMPGRDPGGIIIIILVGIAGALLGGFLSPIFGFGGITGFDLRTLIVTVLGSIKMIGNRGDALLMIRALHGVVFRPRTV
jgi:uncharacterized membrane protein YeaQ/YmgE (transglycosylase-associated protein family)